jgi:hypothetical protein
VNLVDFVQDTVKLPPQPEQRMENRVCRIHPALIPGIAFATHQHNALLQIAKQEKE